MITLEKIIFINARFRVSSLYSIAKSTRINLTVQEVIDHNASKKMIRFKACGVEEDVKLLCYYFDNLVSVHQSEKDVMF